MEVGEISHCRIEVVTVPGAAHERLAVAVAWGYERRL